MTTQTEELAKKLEAELGRYFMQTPDNPHSFWNQAADHLIAEVVKEAKTEALEAAAQAYPTGDASIPRKSVKVWLANRAESTKKGWIR